MEEKDSSIWASFTSHLLPLLGLKCRIGEQKVRKVSSQNNQNMLKFEKFPAMTSGDLSSSMTLLLSSTFMLNSLSPKSMESSLPKMDPPTETRIGFTMSKHGPAFFGQVWSLCDDAGRGPGFVALPKTSIPIPPRISGFIRWIKRMLQEEVEDERIPFFFKDENAENYAKRLRLHGVKCRVRLYNLDSVYPFVKTLGPRKCRYIPDNKQVKLARQLLNSQGRQRKKLGVPVFSVEEVTLGMATMGGVRWFTPYFFDKDDLDAFIDDSVDYYFQWQIHSRRRQRHQQFTKDESSGDSTGEHIDAVLEFPEVDDILTDDGGHDGISVESMLVKAANVQMQDFLDKAVMGSRWSRRLAGIQPKFPLAVDSFEERAAAAESQYAEFLKQKSEPSENVLPNKATTSAKEKESSKTSGRDKSSSEWFKGSSRSKEGLKDGAGTSAPSGQGGKSQQDEEKKGVGKKTVKPDEFLGMLASENLVRMHDSLIHKALSSAAKEYEERVKKGESKFQIVDPLFVAGNLEASNILRGWSNGGKKKV